MLEKFEKKFKKEPDEKRAEKERGLQEAATQNLNIEITRRLAPEIMRMQKLVDELRIKLQTLEDIIREYK